MSLGQNVKVTMGNVIGQNIRVTVNSAGLMTADRPITLRDSRADYNAIDKLIDVDASGKANNTFLIYNNTTNKYEVKPFDEGVIDLIDGGTY